MKRINLLPHERQQALQDELTFRNVKTLILLSSLLLLLVVLGQVGTRVYLQIRLGEYQYKLGNLQAQVNRDDNMKLREEIKKVNQQISDYKLLADRVPKWSNFLRVWVGVVPERVKINQLSADASTRRVDISGVAWVREDALKLHSNIVNASNLFTGINYPFENLVKEHETPFRYSFTIQQEVLK